MDRCNVTGATEGLKDFYINYDFGYNANYLADERFSFNLCQDEFEKLIKTGRDELSADTSCFDDFTCQYGKWFTSEQIYDLISTFQYVPKGYYNDRLNIYTDEEEQLMWDNQGEDIFDLVSYERAEELNSILNGTWA